MEVIVKASDLKYKYPKDTARRNLPKFAGKPDCAPFDRNDLYEILPMLSAVMTELETDHGRILHLLEDILNEDLPGFITTREQVFDCLVQSARDHLGWE